jgi:hypothetical protein
MSSRDYEEFLESLNAHGARYLVVGAHAVAFHARPRATKDLDVFIDPDPQNGEKVLAAHSWLSQERSGADRIAWAARVEGRFSDVPTQYLSLDDLILEKERIGREQDLADAKVLRMARQRRDSP